MGSITIVECTTGMGRRTGDIKLDVSDGETDESLTVRFFLDEGGSISLRLALAELTDHLLPLKKAFLTGYNQLLKSLRMWL